jgi:hypothetical protein
MPIYRMTDDAFEAVPETSFSAHGLSERQDIQRLLRSNIGVVDPDLLVIAEEFTDWEDSKRRIDLLAVDRDANLVVIELKRSEDGGHMELQALRYAAMVSTMTFSRAVDVYRAFLGKLGEDQDAQASLLEFFGWDEPREDGFGQDVRVVLVSADFSRELTTTVLWLNERELDVRCVRLKPYGTGASLLVDVQQVIPLPEAGDYQVRLREKASERREAARQSGEFTGYWFMNTGDGSGEGRCWEDCQRYSFLSMGGGERYIRDIKKLKVGAKVFAYLSKFGYVGLAEVTSIAVPFTQFVPAGQSKPLMELPLVAKIQTDRMHDPQRWDLCVGVRWIKSLDRRNAILMNRAKMGTLQRMMKPELVSELLGAFGVRETQEKDERDTAL